MIHLMLFSNQDPLLRSRFHLLQDHRTERLAEIENWKKTNREVMLTWCL